MQATTKAQPKSDDSEDQNHSEDANWDQDPLYVNLVSNLKTVHHIELLEKLGSGSFSVVVKGMFEGKQVAVKIIDTRSQSEYVQRFLPREVVLVPTIQHPNIVRVFQVLNIPPHMPFITEFCGGGDLLKRIQDNKRIPEDESRILFRQLIEALIYLQSKEIVHRDLKCENIFLDINNNVKLGDFGFARHLKNGEFSNTFCGSRAYVAPEILRAVNYTGQWSDIWSAGVVLFVMVCGVMPYDDRKPQKMVEDQLQHKIRFPRRVDLSNAVKTLIYEILHPYPASRLTYQAMCKQEWLKNTKYQMREGSSRGSA